MLFAAERFRRRAQVRELAASARAPSPTAARELDTLEYREAFVIGAAQSTALVAGISRDGVTMGAGLARGLDHSDSARFAFLLATPIILAAGLVKLPDILGSLGDGVRGQALVACVVAAVTAVFAVRFLVGYFKTKTLIPFAVYCLGVRCVHVGVYARVESARRSRRGARPGACCMRPSSTGWPWLLPPSCVSAMPVPKKTPPKMFETRGQAWSDVGLLHQVSPRAVKRARLEAVVLAVSVRRGGGHLQQPQEPARGRYARQRARSEHGWRTSSR